MKCLASTISVWIDAEYFGRPYRANFGAVTLSSLSSTLIIGAVSTQGVGVLSSMARSEGLRYLTGQNQQTTNVCQCGSLPNSAPFQKVEMKGRHTSLQSRSKKALNGPFRTSQVR